jgi:hypothetical protein
MLTKLTMKLAIMWSSIAEYGAWTLRRRGGRGERSNCGAESGGPKA